jgi:hypothetical protein
MCVCVCHTGVCAWCVCTYVSVSCTESENADDEAAKNFWKLKKSARIELMPAEGDVAFSGDFVPQSLCLCSVWLHKFS